MAITININNLTLIHKDSGGVAKATLPDICMTPAPGGPVPRKYSNTAYSKDIAEGTVTITADGGNMCANRGSQFSKSYGDEPGTLGGIISGTNMAEATWLTWSPDVFLEGRNACRLTDKMLMNHGNTACLGGVLNPPLNVVIEIEILCKIMCKCNEEPIRSSNDKVDLRQECVKQQLQALDSETCDRTTMKPEISYDMTKSPPNPLMHRDANGLDTLRPSEYWQSRTREIEGYQKGIGMVRRPDVVVVSNPKVPPYQDNIKAVVEMKFPDDTRDVKQIAAYEKIAGDPNKVVELDVEKCCSDEQEPEPEPFKVPEPGPLETLLLMLLLTGLVLDDIAPTGATQADDLMIPGVLARLAMAF